MAGSVAAAGAGLEREAVTQKPGIPDDPRRRLCHDERNGIARVMRVVPDTIPAGSPMASICTT